MEKETETVIKALEDLELIHRLNLMNAYEGESARERLGTAIEALIDSRISARLRDLLEDDGK